MLILGQGPSVCIQGCKPTAAEKIMRNYYIQVIQGLSLCIVNVDIFRGLYKLRVSHKLACLCCIAAVGGTSLQLCASTLFLQAESCFMVRHSVISMPGTLNSKSFPRTLNSTSCPLSCPNLFWELVHACPLV